MAFSYLTNKIGVLDLDRLYGVLDIVIDVLSIAGLALALRAPGGRKRMLVIASTFLPVVLCTCLLYTSPSPRDATLSRMPSSA